MRRTGLRAEVVLSLALVMGAATSVLGVLLWHHHEARLREVLGRALLAEARDGGRGGAGLLPGTAWWRIGASGRAEPLAAGAGEPGPAELELARRAREAGRPLLLPGAPWEPIRFAVALERSGGVMVARLPREASWRLRAAPLAVGAVILLLDVALFTAFGVSLLRRRVLDPLARLAAAARALGEGALEARVPVDGPREAAELAEAFNRMSEALARRTGALEKAVAELRTSNRALREARDGLARAERLASVGRLAAGVAHEVGNPVGAQLAFLDLAARDPGLGEAGREHLRRATEQAERVRTILKQLLEFSRPPRPGRTGPVDVGSLARESVGLVAAQQRYRDLDWQVEVAPGTPDAEADPGAVSQILLNLLLNAGDAVQSGPRPRGRVRVRVRPAVRARRAGDPPGEAPPGRRPDAVEVEVADDGAGVAPEDRERIFDPFFTTKDPGEGTGLGLATSARLALELGGELELAAPRAEADAPEGARFVLRLPAAVAFGDGPPAHGLRA